MKLQSVDGHFAVRVVGFPEDRTSIAPDKS
jgi:hypothetical protein